MLQNTVVTLEFEVLVTFTKDMINGNKVPIDATLQIDNIPNYVKEWLEWRAMENFKKSIDQTKEV